MEPEEWMRLLWKSVCIERRRNRTEPQETTFMESMGLLLIVVFSTAIYHLHQDLSYYYSKSCWIEFPCMANPRFHHFSLVLSNHAFSLLEHDLASQIADNDYILSITGTLGECVFRKQDLEQNPKELQHAGDWWSHQFLYSWVPLSLLRLK